MVSVVFSLGLLFSFSCVRYLSCISLDDTAQLDTDTERKRCKTGAAAQYVKDAGREEGGGEGAKQTQQAETEGRGKGGGRKDQGEEKQQQEQEESLPVEHIATTVKRTVKQSVWDTSSNSAGAGDAGAVKFMPLLLLPAGTGSERLAIHLMSSHQTISHHVMPVVPVVPVPPVPPHPRPHPHPHPRAHPHPHLYYHPSPHPRMLMHMHISCSWEVRGEG